MDIKVGFIVCGVHAEVEDALGRPMLDIQLVENAFNTLKNAGLTVYRIKGVLSRSEEFEKALRECKEQDVDCVVFYAATWLWASEIWGAALAFGGPIAIWCAPTAVGWATGGALVLHGALDEIGVKHELFYGYPDDERTMNDMMAFIRAAATASRLRDSRLGLVGGYSMGAVTGATDIPQVMSKFGVKVEHVDQFELVKRAEAFSRGNVEDTYNKLKKSYGNLPKLDKVMERSIRLYIALRDLTLQRKFDVTAVKCFPELGDNYATACLAQSLLPEEGLVTSCIGDVNTALSAYILHLLSGGATFNPDVQRIKKDEGIVILASDGAAPPSLAANPESIVLKCRGLATEGAADGISIGFICKPGPVTLIRLCRIKGEYCMHIASGEAFVPENAEELLKECGFPHWPHAFIKLKGDVEAFIQNQRSEYISMCYGDYKEELVDLCHQLEVRPIVTSWFAPFPSEIF